MQAATPGGRQKNNRHHDALLFVAQTGRFDR